MSEQNPNCDDPNKPESGITGTPISMSITAVNSNTILPQITQGMPFTVKVKVSGINPTNPAGNANVGLIFEPDNGTIVLGEINFSVDLTVIPGEQNVVSINISAAQSAQLPIGQLSIAVVDPINIITLFSETFTVAPPGQVANNEEKVSMYSDDDVTILSGITGTPISVQVIVNNKSVQEIIQGTPFIVQVNVLGNGNNINGKSTGSLVFTDNGTTVLKGINFPVNLEVEQGQQVPVLNNISAAQSAQLPVGQLFIAVEDLVNNQPTIFSSTPFTVVPPNQVTKNEEEVSIFSGDEVPILSGITGTPISVQVVVTNETDHQSREK